MNNENIIFANRYKLLQRQQHNDIYEWWKAEDIKTKNVVAIKCTKNNSVPTAGAALLKEFLLLTQVQHPNLLMPLYYYDFEGQSYIIFPFADGFSLQDELLQDVSLQETEAVKVMVAIAHALQALHQHHILHRNIHPANIFKINQQYILGHFKRSSDTIATTENMPYLAPELFSQMPEYTEKSDVFALCVVMFQLCTNMLPWQGLGGIALLKGAAVPQLPNRFSDNLKNLLFKCMAAQPKDRPELQEILDSFSKEKTNTPQNIVKATEPTVSLVIDPATIPNEEVMNTLVTASQATSDGLNATSKSNKIGWIVLILLLCLSGGVWAYFKIQKN